MPLSFIVGLHNGNAVVDRQCLLPVFENDWQRPLTTDIDEKDRGLSLAAAIGEIGTPVD